MKIYQKPQRSGHRTFQAWNQQNAPLPFRLSQSPALNSQPAFTLIELLVVIAIIAVLAAFTLPVAKAVKRYQYIHQTTAEMKKLELAIEGYNDTYRFYPPSSGDKLVPPLYFELIGVTLNGATNTTLDGSASIATSDVPVGFPGVSGFVNCTKGSGEDATPAKIFLSGLKPQQIGIMSNHNAVVTILVGSAGGPDSSYQPFGSGVTGLNPWRYMCPGTNNPNSYDLWIQLVIGGKTNLICNWNSQVQINNSSVP